MPTKKTAKKPRAAKRLPRGKPLSAGKDHTRSDRADELHGLAMAGPFNRVMTAYAELPGRLLACRSPVEFWAEYVRFGQRLFAGLMPSAAPAPSHRARASGPGGRSRS